MAHEVDLPEIFPVDEIIVKEEEHLFEVFQGDSGPLPKTEYTLDKAPIINIRTVTGTLNGATGHEFTEGVDYELSTDDEDIVWLNNDRPDAGTNFFVTYTTDSILSRYIDSSAEEFESVDEEIIGATQAKFLSDAEGSELDAIGRLFGDVIGKRRGRNDTQYSIYLQSVVQSFISRGTKTGIKLAISAATDVPVADITINEDFTTNQYEVIVIPDTAVRVSLLETIADIADPSGVEQIRTRFPVFDEMGVDDRTTNRFSDAETFDEMVVTDANASFRRALNDSMAFDDAATLQAKAAIINESLFSDDAATLQAKAADITDSLFSDDAAVLQPKAADLTDVMATDDATASTRGATSDDVTADDTAATATTNTAWDSGSWDSMNWTVEHN
jgi:hypothetical protein